MGGKSVRWLSLIGLAVVLCVGAALAKERTWTSSKGTFSITAEYRGVRGDSEVLRDTKGKELVVPLARLSDADREFVQSQAEKKSGPLEDEAAKPTDDPAAADKAKPPREAIAEIAERFYADLRTKERDAARQTLTQKAESLIKDGKSPLTALPQPEAGDKSIKLGKVKLDGQVAEIPVLVRVGTELHRTKLHLRFEDNQWHVFALSAVYPDGEKSINFEAEAAAAGTDTNPLLALVGKPIEVAGITLDGQAVSSAQFKGKIVLVDFWATWCGPCRAEMPNIAANWAKHHDAGFEVMAVSVDQDLQALRTFTAEEKPPWTVVADNHPQNKNSMGAKFGIRAIPAMILIGQDGNVAAVQCRGKSLGLHLERLLAGGNTRTSSAPVDKLR